MFHERYSTFSVVEQANRTYLVEIVLNWMCLKPWNSIPTYVKIEIAMAAPRLVIFFNSGMLFPYFHLVLRVVKVLWEKSNREKPVP